NSVAVGREGATLCREGEKRRLPTDRDKPGDGDEARVASRADAAETWWRFVDSMPPGDATDLGRIPGRGPGKLQPYARLPREQVVSRHDPRRSAPRRILYPPALRPRRRDDDHSLLLGALHRVRLTRRQTAGTGAFDDQPFDAVRDHRVDHVAGRIAIAHHDLDLRQRLEVDAGELRARRATPHRLPVAHHLVRITQAES